jgi:uncharacterized membrane protein HdeD (DUF308 family)
MWRWVSLVLGLAAIVVGATLTLKPYSSLDTLVLVLSASLILAGLGDLFFRDEDERATWGSRLSGVALVAAGIVALVVPDATVRLIAIIAGVALIVSGVARLASGLRRQADERLTPILGGIAALVLGVVALAWRDVTVLIVALLIGPVVVILGVGQVYAALTDRRNPVFRRRDGGPARGLKWLRMGGAIVALALALVLAGVSSFIHEGSPEVDAFYSAPDSVPGEPGQLLRTETFTRALPEGAVAERILYTTTREDDSPALASALVVWPEDLPDGPRPVLAWAHGTTGVAEKCAPSLLPDPFTAGGMPAIEDVLDRGWVIVATDYVGLGTEGPHPYLVGVPEARSVLDAVRAARQMDNLELAEETVVWGHSQGGGATLWTGIEAESYAPDVPLAGVAALAPASDLASLAGGLTGNPGGSLFAAYIVEGYSATYDDVDFNDYVRDSAVPVMEEVAGRCINEPAILVSVGEILMGEPVFSEDLDEGELLTRLQENVPDEVTGLPTFIAQGLTDNLVLPEAQERFVQTLCDGGLVVDYRTYEGRDHLGVVASDSPMVPDLLEWTEARFAGDPPPAECTTSTG